MGATKFSASEHARAFRMPSAPPDASLPAANAATTFRRETCTIIPAGPARLAAIQLREDVPGEVFVDFAMAWHGLGEPRGGIAVPVVLAAVPD